MAPIPASNRREVYNPVSSAGPFPVSFPVFSGDGSDLKVTLSGVDQVGWTFSGTLEGGVFGAPNTWVDGAVTLAAPVSGELVILGKRAPRRQSQYQEGRGINARDLNTDLNTLVATDQELRRDTDELQAKTDQIDDAVAAAQAAQAAAEVAQAAAEAVATPIAQNRILARSEAGTGPASAHTGTQVTALLDTFTPSTVPAPGLKGLVPALAAGQVPNGSRVLRDDGWGAPPAAGNDSLRAPMFPPANDTTNLPAIRRRLRHLPDLLDYGTFSDMTSAMNAALTAATAEGWRRILVPAGVWTQNTAPNAIDRGLLFEGEDRSSTTVSVNHTGSGFTFTGQNGGGGGVRNLFVQVPGATSPFAAVRAEGNQLGYAPDGLELSNLWITYQSTGRWTYGLFLDGQARGQSIVTGTLSVAPPANVLTVSGASYGVNQFANGLRQVRFTSGAAAGQTRPITANTSNTITMATSLAPNAGSGDVFVVETVLYGLRDCVIDKIITFGTTTDALLIRNMRAAFFSRILANGVGGTSRISLVGNSSAASERNDGIEFSACIFGQLLINNTNGLNGFCKPQSGINQGGGITNSSLLMPSAYKSAGPSVPPISGLDLP